MAANVTEISDDDRKFMAVAMEELRASYKVGGIPVGAALVSANGILLGQGRNLRVQEGSAIKHVPPTHPLMFSALSSADRNKAETSAIEATALHHPPYTSSNPAPASLYKGSTMYTTLIPCAMCTGAMLLHGIKRVVYGCKTDVIPSPDTIALLEQYGVECVYLEVEESGTLLGRWIKDNPERYQGEPWARGTDS